MVLLKSRAVCVLPGPSKGWRLENRRDIFLCMVLSAVRMVADVTETRNVIPSLEFKTCMTIRMQMSRQQLE